MGAFIRRFEGGYANDPDDPGGHTMRGVTLATYEYYCRLPGIGRPGRSERRAAATRPEIRMSEAEPQGEASFSDFSVRGVGFQPDRP